MRLGSRGQLTNQAWALSYKPLASLANAVRKSQTPRWINSGFLLGWEAPLVLMPLRRSTGNESRAFVVIEAARRVREIIDDLLDDPSGLPAKTGRLIEGIRSTVGRLKLCHPELGFSCDYALIAEDAEAMAFYLLAHMGRTGQFWRLGKCSECATYFIRQTKRADRWACSAKCRVRRHYEKKKKREIG